MIIYGTNGAHRRTEAAPGLACPACASPDHLHLSVFSRYAHVYWIPLFPYSKPVVAECRSCQGAWAEKELPATATEVRQAAQLLQKHTAAPWWHWSGLGLLALGLVWAFVANSRDQQANTAYLTAPRAGDVYTVRADDSLHTRYTLLKVVRAQGNTVQLVANEYETDNAHPLTDLNHAEKYSREPFELTQLDLQIMQNKGQLTDVDRLGE